LIQKLQAIDNYKFMTQHIAKAFKDRGMCARCTLPLRNCWDC